MTEDRQRWVIRAPWDSPLGTDRALDCVDSLRELESPQERDMVVRAALESCLGVTDSTAAERGVSDLVYGAAAVVHENIIGMALWTHCAPVRLADPETLVPLTVAALERFIRIAVEVEQRGHSVGSEYFQSWLKVTSTIKGELEASLGVRAPGMLGSTVWPRSWEASEDNWPACEVQYEGRRWLVRPWPDQWPSGMVPVAKQDGADTQ